MKEEKFKPDLFSKKPIRDIYSHFPISDLDSFEVISLAKRVSNWELREDKTFYGNLFKGRDNEREIFTDKLYLKLNLEDKSDTSLRFYLKEEVSKSFFRGSKKEHFLYMDYSRDGFGGAYKGNLIKKFYFEVKDKL